MWLVTGANGQLGQELKRMSGIDAVYVNRYQLDISDEKAVKSYLEKNEFDGIINCAAYTAVDRAEDEPEKADKTNHLGPQWLARYGKCIIHISTDYVFDGNIDRPYREDDNTCPNSIYGSSKLMGKNSQKNFAQGTL